MIIGICGHKGSGKSVVASYLAENHGFTRVNFKQALIDEMKEKFPDTLQAICDHFKDLCPDFDTEEPWTIDSLFVEKPSIMRELMQNHGTDVRRKDDPEYWVNQWLEKVKETKGNIVTDDVRFFNELSALGDMDGVLIRVVREDITTGGTHVSETEQEKFIEDFTIEAKKGDHKDVYRQIESILEDLKAD